MFVITPFICKTNINGITSIRLPLAQLLCLENEKPKLSTEKSVVSFNFEKMQVSDTKKYGNRLYDVKHH